MSEPLLYHSPGTLIEPKFELELAITHGLEELSNLHRITNLHYHR